MNCAKHPQNVAIATCPSCGRNICEECRVNIVNMPHCKECAEWLLFQMASAYRIPKVPMPRGQPRKELFTIGSAGSIVMLISAFCIGIFMFTEHSIFGLTSYPWWLILWGAVFSGGMIVNSVGFYGFYKNYGSTMGLITFVFLLISSFIFIASFIFSVHAYHEDFGPFQPEPWRYSIGPEIVGAVFIFGVCLVLMGVTFLVVKNYTMEVQLSTATGIFTIIVAALFCSVFLAIFVGIAWFISVMACLLMAIVFFLAKLPPKFAGHLPSQIPSPKPITGPPP